MELFGRIIFHNYYNDAINISYGNNQYQFVIYYTDCLHIGMYSRDGSHKYGFCVRNATKAGDCGIDYWADGVQKWVIKVDYVV